MKSQKENGGGCIAIFHGILIYQSDLFIIFALKEISPTTHQAIQK